MHRREFLATSPALFFAPSVITRHLRPRPLQNYRVALIGTGWYGKMDLLRLLQVTEAEVVGLCDVDQKVLAAADRLIRTRHPGQRPRLYANHRELLRKEQPEIVLIDTPDHWHALHAIDALAAGANLYLQKPISVDVREGQALVAAAKKYGGVIQVGLQRRNTPHLVRAKREFVDSGRLGKISHVDLCCYYKMRDTARRPVTEIPDHFDYETWTGPAPLLPFRGIPHRRWRAFQEYGNGIVGDMCVHMFDAARWMLGLGWPSRVSSTGGIIVQTEADATTTDTQTAIFEYPHLQCVWQHRTWGTPADPEWPWAFMIYGSEGTLKGDTQKVSFIPNARDGQTITYEALYEKEKYPEDLEEQGIELHVASATRAHLRDFLRAIDEGRLPAATIEEGHISTASCILANLSQELGRPLAYDPISGKVINDPEATARLARPYRSGYSHPWHA
ncbi:Gfo/Idh/MocA family protein [Lewinella sp. W8]|uniref:Gfo/Idh/MocA family protein n=1 Tax=Lewinella sp. W8 TaxID=2528208 RepID=UPI00106773B2|nr:Gfo/Idh/MocA family oxidoreductase [Lewinella sp. W8]MTB49560.1 gfo/Idh/MocA family oxidoreductase [Lewinella sp. W8]